MKNKCVVHLHLKKYTNLQIVFQMCIRDRKCSKQRNNVENNSTMRFNQNNPIDMVSEQVQPAPTPVKRYIKINKISEQVEPATTPVIDQMK